MKLGHFNLDKNRTFLLSSNKPSKYAIVQANMGLGFLRFSGLSGSMARLNSPNMLGGKNQIQGRINYTRTPLLEVFFAKSLASWFQVGLSYQHQGPVDVNLNPQSVPLVGGPKVNSLFSSNLRLDAFAFKCYLTSPLALVVKAISYNLYLGLGVGPAWQTWSNLRIISSDHRILTNPAPSRTFSYTSDNYAMPNQYSANCFFMVDAGLKIRSFFSTSGFSALLGCKYNQWGQARNIGKSRNANGYGTNTGLNDPITIKTVYQFAPYLGFQFDF